MSLFIIKNKEKVVSMCRKLIDDKISGKNLNSEKHDFAKVLLKELNLKDRKFNSKEEFYSLFKVLYKKGLEELTEELNNYDKDFLIFCVVNLESYLARISLIKINGTFIYSHEDEKHFPKLTKNIEINKKSQDGVEEKLFLNNVNTNVAFYKMGADTIMNLILNMENNGSVDKINKYQMHKLILRACQLWNLYTFLKIPHNEDDINYKDVFIKDFNIYSSKSKNRYIEASVNYVYQDFDNGLDDESFNELCKIYEKKVKYSPKMLVQYCKNIKSKYIPQIFSRSELKEFCTLDSFPVDGFDNLYNDLVLKPNSSVFDKNNRVSKKGIIKVSDDNYIFDKNLFIQYILLLSNKMKNPNFSNNKNIINYIKNKMVESWLKELQKRLQEKNIWHEINQNIPNNIVDDSVKKVSKEIDLLLYNKADNVLMIVEYKNWEKKAYNLIEENKEIDKIKKHVKKRVELIKMIENSLDLFINSRSKEFDGYPKLELFVVFEERNVLCNKRHDLNDEIKVNYFSVKDFETLVFNNASNFQK